MSGVPGLSTAAWSAAPAGRAVGSAIGMDPVEPYARLRLSLRPTATRPMPTSTKVDGSGTNRKFISLAMNSLPFRFLPNARK